MKYLTFFVFMMILTQASAQQQGTMTLLYGDEQIPGSLKSNQELDEQWEVPKLYAHLSDNQDKDVVFLIIPGGGYAGVAIDHEGHQVAQRLNQYGYSAYVLFYRLPNAENMKDKRFGPLQDAQYALASIRKAHPAKRVAVIGFSAGGHLAASLSNLYELPQTDELKEVNLRPDISVLCYPVISMDDAITHQGTKQNLIGPNASEQDEELFSLDLQVTANNQPTFLMSAKDDKVVPIENTYRYLDALKAADVEYSLFTYQQGGHGFGLVNKTDKRDWLAAMLKWLEQL